MNISQYKGTRGTVSAFFPSILSQQVGALSAGQNKYIFNNSSLPFMAVLQLHICSKCFFFFFYKREELVLIPHFIFLRIVFDVLKQF